MLSAAAELNAHVHTILCLCVSDTLHNTYPIYCDYPLLQYIKKTKSNDQLRLFLSICAMNCFSTNVTE